MTSGVVRLGLGLAAVARPAYITSGRDADLGPDRSVQRLRRRCLELLDAAHAGGVRYVDVARSYGRAEEFVADWFAARDRAGRPVDDVRVGSKWGYRYVGDWRPDAAVHEVKDHSAAAFAEQVVLSRSLLGDRLAVYHVHSATLDTGVLADRALHRSLAALRADGIRVGLSTSGPRQPDTVRAALAVRVDGEPLFSSVQATWNLLEPSAGPALAEAAAAGCQVIVKEVVANGRLAGPGGPDATAQERAVRAAAADLGVTPDGLAYQATLSRPWAWRVLSGAATVDQLTGHLAAATDPVPVDRLDSVVEALVAAAEDPAEYWARRAGRPWL